MVISGPRISEHVAQVLAQDPVLQFERASDGPWTLVDRKTGTVYRSGQDETPPRNWDVAYLGRLPRPDGQGSLIVFTGIHPPPGSLGVVHLLCTRIGELYSEVKTDHFSVLVGADYDRYPRAAPRRASDAAVPVGGQLTQVTMATSLGKPDQPNEDFTAATPNGVVLLDGAGLSGTTSRCSHGVAWYTRHLGGALLAGLPGDNGQDLPAMLAEAISQTAAAHANTCDLDDAGTPSATVIMLRCAGNHLEYLVLADSVLVLDQADDAPLVITDDREAHVGQRYHNAMDNLANGTPEHDDARRDYVQALRAHRNRPGGFWVAAADPRAADEAIIGSCPIKGVTAAVLLSDGASRLSDRFGLTDWPGILAILRDHGPSELIYRVRAAEASDLQGARWPRGKTHDDASIAYCTRLHDA